jgi:uncharacterized membrane protein
VNPGLLVVGSILVLIGVAQIVFHKAIDRSRDAQLSRLGDITSVARRMFRTWRVTIVTGCFMALLGAALFALALASQHGQAEEPGAPGVRATAGGDHLMTIVGILLAVLGGIALLIARYRRRSPRTDPSSSSGPTTWARSLPMYQSAATGLFFGGIALVGISLVTRS